MLRRRNPQQQETRPAIREDQDTCWRPSNAVTWVLRIGFQDAIKTLSDNIDLIVHAGASRSPFDAYQLLRGANFEFTKTLMQLAAARRIPFHFISSAAVRALANSTPPTGGSMG